MFFSLLTTSRGACNKKAQVDMEQSCANHVQRVACATWYEGKAQLLSWIECLRVATEICVREPTQLYVLPQRFVYVNQHSCTCCHRGMCVCTNTNVRVATEKCARTPTPMHVLLQRNVYVHQHKCACCFREMCKRINAIVSVAREKRTCI